MDINCPYTGKVQDDCCQRNSPLPACAIRWPD